MIALEVRKHRRSDWGIQVFKLSTSPPRPRLRGRHQAFGMLHVTYLEEDGARWISPYTEPFQLSKSPVSGILVLHPGQHLSPEQHPGPIACYVQLFVVAFIRRQ